MAEKISIISIYLDREIIDITRLSVVFGSFTKKFLSYEKLAKWKMKAKKLEGGDIFYYDLWQKEK